MKPIKLMQSTFCRENEAKQFLCDFIRSSAKLSMGEYVIKWETAFSIWQGRKYSVCFNSGSSANLALLQAILNVGLLAKGDLIGFSAVTWATNPMPIIQLGLNPIAIDVNINNLNVSLENIKSVKRKHPEIKCIFITNLLGFCSDLEKISEYCRAENAALSILLPFDSI